MAGLGKLCGRFSPSFRRLYQHFSKEDKIFRSILVKRYFQKDASLYATTTLDMPALSPTMTKGNIVKWHKKEGDTISPGDVLCEIETDKAVIAMDTEEEGILAKIIAPDNTQDIDVGQLIALLVEEGDDWKNVEVPAAATAAPKGGSPSADAAPATAAAAAPSASTEDHSGDGHLIGPSVKKLLQEYAINASSIPASGPSGALLKGDVLSYIQTQNLSKVDQTPAATPAATALPSPATAPVSPPPPSSPTTQQQTSSTGSNFVDIPLSSMRRVIAKRLTESKTTIPHAYASIASSIDAVTELRKSLADGGIKVSMNDFVIKAASLALRRVPQINGIWSNDSPNLTTSVDISVAVATPNGLITPIVKGASYLSVQQIGDKVKEMAGRAREGKLRPDEYQGGSFSISNLGMFGISEFTAVINPPQMAIMAVGTGRNVATMEGNKQKMTVTLSYDSRGVDEVDATRFLEEFRNALEHPHSMLAGTDLDTEAEAFAF